MILFDLFPIVSLLIFIVLITGKVIFLKRKGIKTGSRTGQNKLVKKLIDSLFGIILLLLFFEICNPVLKLPFHLLPEKITRPLFESTILKFAGIVITGGSFLFLGYTLIHFGNSLRFGLNEKNLGKLITTGSFAVSRNPFFVSAELYFLGTALIKSNLFFLIISFLSIISIHFFILKEEKFLQKNYGDEYKKYAEKTGRYFTFPFNRRKNKGD